MGMRSCLRHKFVRLTDSISRIEHHYRTPKCICCIQIHMARAIHRLQIHLYLISCENALFQLIRRDSQEEQSLFLVLRQLVEQISRLTQESKCRIAWNTFRGFRFN